MTLSRTQWPQQLGNVAFGEQRLFAGLRAAVHAVGQGGLAFLQREDAFFDGAVGHQFVDKYAVFLADAVARSVAWFSTAGFHHGS